MMRRTRARQIHAYDSDKQSLPARVSAHAAGACARNVQVLGEDEARKNQIASGKRLRFHRAPCSGIGRLARNPTSQMAASPGSSGPASMNRRRCSPAGGLVKPGGQALLSRHHMLAVLQKRIENDKQDRANNTRHIPIF